MDSQKRSVLLATVELLKAQPQLLHSPDLKFFTEYLGSLGAKLPPAAPAAADSQALDEEAMNVVEDLDLTDVVSDEEAVADYVQGNIGTSVDGEAGAMALELMSQGRQALNEGNPDRAIQLLNESISKAAVSARSVSHSRCLCRVLAATIFDLWDCVYF